MKSVGLSIVAGFLLLHPAAAQIAWTEQEKPIVERMKLRELPDEERARVTKTLALEIRRLPSSPNRVTLAARLANLATEGDFGRDTLQEVTTTLAQALKEQPQPDQHGAPAEPYLQVARLVRYEGMKAKLSDPQFAAAMKKLEAEDESRRQAGFSLNDLEGRTWSLKDLRGKVVLVNFWATWCPPCRKEMPDLERLHAEFKDKGLVILAASDEDASKVKPFIAEKKYSFPILLDPGRRVSKALGVDGIPKTFVYDRNGELVAQAIDMRTRKQFLQMLAKAGLK